MQPYSYVVVPNPNATTVPVRFIVPPNYQQSSSIRSPKKVPQPVYYQPVYQATSVPMMPYAQPYQYPPAQQYLQPYYYVPNDTNIVNPGNMSNSKTSKVVQKKDDKKNKRNQSLIGNSDVNELLKQKGTKVRLSKSYRITKKKHNAQDDDTSDDEYEQVPLDSPRPRTFKPVPVPSQRIPSATSSCSHCSTCTNCSCSDCRIRNGGHIYDDCPECRAEAELYQAQGSYRKHK